MLLRRGSAIGWMEIADKERSAEEIVDLVAESRYLLAKLGDGGF